MESDGQWRTHKHKNYQEGSKKKMTVLSVDDDPTNQMVVQKLLDAHFNIVQAMSGQEALDIISNSAKPPDFVLLDVMMPKMSGLEVCEKVREKFPMCDLPIIMISAKSQPQHVVEGLKKGANDYMAKPINRDELLARIRAQLMICHNCRMVCKSSSSEDPFFVCNKCRRSKPKALTRRPSLDLARNLVSELPNAIEILTHVPFGITLFSTVGHVLMRNTEARNQFADLPDTTANLSTAFLPHALDRVAADQILSDAKQGGKFETTVEVYSPSNTPIFHRIFAKTISMSTPEKSIEAYILVVEWDVTDWWRRREEVASLHALDQQKTELIFDLAHNLKGPLSGLAALADDGDTTPQNGISLSTIALRMARLVDEIADYAEVTNPLDDTHATKNAAIQISEVLDGVDTLFTPTYRAKGVTVVRDLLPMPLVLAQRHKLSLLFSNMLDISIHYTRSRMITIRAHTGSERATVVVSFTDNSRTCSPEELEELFSKSPVQGYLPPVIVRKVADAIGASITFTPLAQGGSSINVMIPEVCLSSSVTETRASTNQSTSSIVLQQSISAPNFPQRKEKMEPIIEVDSPPRPALRRTSSTPIIPLSLRASATIPLPPTTTPLPLSHKPERTASQLRTSYPPASPEPPLILNPPDPTPSQASAIESVMHPVTPASTSLPSPSLPSITPHAPQYAPPISLTPQAPQPPPQIPEAKQKPEEVRPSGANFLFGKHDENQSLEKEIKELEARLAMAKSMYKIRKLSVKFKRADQPFFHQVNMENNSIEQLRTLITKRLKLNPEHWMMIVKDQDTLVEMDEDIEDGMLLDVHIPVNV